MNPDLICTITRGGIRHFMDTGQYRECFTFSSESLNLRTGVRTLKEGINTGYIANRNKEKVFYYELDPETDTCMVYRVKNNIKDSKGFQINAQLILAD